MKLSALRERAIVDILKYMDYSFKVFLFYPLLLIIYRYIYFNFF